MRRAVIWSATVATSVAYVVLGPIVIGSDAFTLSDSLWLLLSAPPFAVAAAYLMWRRPESLAGDLLMGVAICAFGLPNLLSAVVVLAFVAQGPEAWMWLPIWLAETSLTVGVVLAAALIALLPDGRPRYAHERYFGVVALVLGALPTLSLATHEVVPVEAGFPGVDGIASPIFVPALEPLGSAVVAALVLSLLVIAFGIVGLLVRYRRGSTRERRQLRWVLLAGTLVMVSTIVPNVLAALGVFGATGLLPSAELDVWHVVGYLPNLLLPLSIVAAVTEPRWIDIDVVIRRSFVLGALSLFILGTYVLGTASIGLALGADLPIELALLLTVVIAVVLQPIRARLQRLADRWVFGDRPSRLEALADFGSSVDSVNAPAELVDRLATSIKQALRLRWATVTVPGLAGRTVGQRDGQPALELEIGRGGEQIGYLTCGQPVDGVLGSDDIALARALADQAAFAISNSRLAARIVEAQEEERHRIERNLHDGAQQELVALAAQLSLARSRVEAGTLDVAALDELQEAARRILHDVRELAQGISPSIVRDGGIVAAVEERCARLPIEVTLDIEPSLRRTRFATQIEGAAYFLVAESLANVLKHAGATRARVSVRQQGGRLAVAVADNGHGFQPEAREGGGLAGLEDRITALGGAMEVRSRPDSGTLVAATFPVSP